MINAIGDRVKAGEKFGPSKGYSDIIGNFDVQFRPMHPSHYWDWLNCACWFYDNEKQLPRAAMFYPDMQGKFPWEPGANNGPSTSNPSTISPRRLTEQRADLV